MFKNMQRAVRIKSVTRLENEKEEVGQPSLVLQSKLG